MATVSTVFQQKLSTRYAWSKMQAMQTIIERPKQEGKRSTRKCSKMKGMLTKRSQAVASTNAC